MKLLRWLWLLLAIPAGAQVSNPSVVPWYSATPPTSCPSALPVYIIANGYSGAGNAYGNNSASTGTTCNLLWSGSSGGGVTSFNTRTGAVSPAANDYSYSQLSASTLSTLCTALQFATGTSINITVPSCASAGQLMTVAIGSGYNLSTIGGSTIALSGWTCPIQANQNNLGSNFCAKFLTASDISTGHVTVTFAGSYNAVFAVVVSNAPFGIGPSTILASDTAAAGVAVSPVSTGCDSTPRTTDQVVYIGLTRVSAGSVGVSVSLGTQLQQANDGSVMSGVISSLTPTTAGCQGNPSFSWTGGNNWVFLLSFNIYGSPPQTL